MSICTCRSAMRGSNLRWQEQRRPWNGQHIFNWCFRFRIPAEGIAPGDFDIFDFDTAGFGETKANVVPIVQEDDRRLFRGRQSENMFVGSLVDLLLVNLGFWKR